MSKFENLVKALERKKADARSCWRCGVCDFAIELLIERVEDFKNYEAFLNAAEERGLQRVLLNGAKNWDEFSWGGCFLIYNEGIAEALCTPSELKKTKNGERKPNKNEEWLDVQARALYQAYLIIKKCLIEVECSC